MVWYRIDNRLVHGQIIESWLPYTDAGHLFVANDQLARDPLRRQIISLAVPAGVRVRFVPLTELAAGLKECGRNENVFVLMADCADAETLSGLGVRMEVLNVGNLHYGPGKRRLLPHVAVSDEDVACLGRLEKSNVRLDFRCTPGEAERALHDVFH